MESEGAPQRLGFPHLTVPVDGGTCADVSGLIRDWATDRLSDIISTTHRKPLPSWVRDIVFLPHVHDSAPIEGAIPLATFITPNPDRASLLVSDVRILDLSSHFAKITLDASSIHPIRFVASLPSLGPGSPPLCPPLAVADLSDPLFLASFLESTLPSPSHKFGHYSSSPPVGSRSGVATRIIPDQDAAEPRRITPATMELDQDAAALAAFLYSPGADADGTSPVSRSVLRPTTLPGTLEQLEPRELLEIYKLLHNHHHRDKFFGSILPMDLAPSKNRTFLGAVAVAHLARLNVEEVLQEWKCTGYTDVFYHNSRKQAAAGRPCPSRDPYGLRCHCSGEKASRDPVRSREW